MKLLPLQWIAAGLIALSLLAAPAIASVPTEADNQFTFAVRLQQRGEIALAEDAFEDFLNLYPDDIRRADAHYYLALLAREQGQIADAMQHLRQAKGALHVQAEARQILHGQLLVQSKLPAEALKQLEPIDPAALIDDPSRATLHHITGVAYWQSGNQAAAAKRFEAAAAMDTPQRGRALLDLGRTYVSLKRPADALRVLREAARADADQAGPALLLAANIAYQQKQFDLAGQLYQQIIEQHQTHSAFGTALLGQMAVLSSQQRDAELIQQYAARAELMPDAHRGEALYLLTLAQFRTKAYDAAAASCDQFRKQYPGHARTLDIAWMQATVHFTRGDYEAFDAAAQRYIAEFPASPRLWDMRQLFAQSAINQGAHDEAIARLTLLIDDEQAPSVAALLAQRGSVHGKAGRSAEALADYRRVIDNHPDYAQLTLVMLNAVDHATAVQDHEQAIRITDAVAQRADVVPDALAVAQFKKAVALIRSERSLEALAALDALLNVKLPPQFRALADYYRGLLLASRAHNENQPEGVDPLVGDARMEAYSQAIVSLTAALDGPLGGAERVQSWQLLAKVYRLTDQVPKCLDAYQQLAQELPDAKFDLNTRLWIGVQLQVHDRPAEALVWLEPVLTVKELSGQVRAEALYRVAACYQKLEQYEPAAERFMKLAAFSTLYGEQGTLGLAQCLAALGRTDEALDEFDRLTDAAASAVAATALYEGAMLRRDLAAASQAGGDTKRARKLRIEARKRLQRVVILYQTPQLTPIPQQAAMALAELLVADGEVKQARRAIEELIERNDENVWGQLGRAELALLNGQRSDAVYQMRQVIQHKPRDAKAADRAQSRLAQLNEPVE